MNKRSPEKPESDVRSTIVVEIQTGLANLLFRSEGNAKEVRKNIALVFLLVLFFGAAYLIFDTMYGTNAIKEDVSDAVTNRSKNTPSAKLKQTENLSEALRELKRLNETLEDSEK